MLHGLTLRSAHDNRHMCCLLVAAAEKRGREPAPRRVRLEQRWSKGSACLLASGRTQVVRFDPSTMTVQRVSLDAEHLQREC